jgi:hypothetical protein
MLATIQLRFLHIPFFTLKALRSKYTKIQFYILFRVNVKLRYLALREYEDIWNQVLSKVFGSEREKVTGLWRKLHNGGLLNCYSSSSFHFMIQSVKPAATSEFQSIFFKAFLGLHVRLVYAVLSVSAFLHQLFCPDSPILSVLIFYFVLNVFSFRSQ